VAEVAVYGVPDERWGQAVHAAVVLRDGARASDEEVLAACQRLSRYKRPKQIRMLDALPRNAAGKIMRRRLRSEAVT